VCKLLSEEQVHSNLRVKKRVVNTLLIQPPETASPVARIESDPADSRVFAPPWDLLALSAYLKARTRHSSRIVDGRLFRNLEREMVEAFAILPPPRVAVVNTSTTGLGQTASVLEIVKRTFPDTTTVLMGQHPSHFPDEALLPRADFALAGDPEPILRNLLDHMGVEQRLARAPGLIRHGQHAPPRPYWLDALKGLCPTDWDGVFWPPYQGPHGTGAMCRAEARLSRGHTRALADRAFSGAAVPFRQWPFHKIASSIQRCAAHGIHDVFIADPPGFWTVERLAQWCATLERERNEQGWSLQLLPAAMTEDIVALLAASMCVRVEILVPSCEAGVLEKYGCTVGVRELARTAALLKRRRIRVHLRFWVGGPEEPGGEHARIVRFIRATGFCPYTLEAFPLNLDAPLYAEAAIPDGTPTLQEWMKWARDPWRLDRPVPLWGGMESAAQLNKTMIKVQSGVQLSPRRLALRSAERCLGKNWLAEIERKAVGLLARPRRPNA